MAATQLKVAVVLGDPRLPYLYAPGGRFGAEELEAVEHLRSALNGLAGYRFCYFDDHRTLIDDLRGSGVDLVLNLCDTGFRNQWAQERNIPGLLEMLEIPYTGADPTGMTLSNDKALVAEAARLRGVPVPEQRFADLGADNPSLPARYPAFIKPNVSAGSLGIEGRNLVHSADEASALYAILARELDVPEVVIQDFLPGAEYTIGLVGNSLEDFVVLPPLEVDFSGLAPDLPQVLTYGSKADPDSPYWQQLSFKRAGLSEADLQALVTACARLFGRLGFRDYARFDFRCDAAGKPRLLDANTNPTWYSNGKMALMAEWLGYDYAGFLRLILQAAARRYRLL